MCVLSSFIALFISVTAFSNARADALERLRPERLKAVHEAVAALKMQRRPVIRSSGYEDVRTLLHVHSAFSHDSRGTIEEIIAAAKETGVRVIMFNEHPSNSYDYFVDGHRGVKDGILLIPGAETGGFLAYPRQSIENKDTDSPQAFSDLVRATGGLVFLCHLEERMDWEIANVTGTEIYNIHADLKDETRFIAVLKSPLAVFGLAGALKQYPQEVFAALFDYPADYLKRFDELCRLAPHTGVSGSDAHHNVGFRAQLLEGGQVRVEDALGEAIAMLDPEKLAPIKLLTAGKKPGDLIFQLDLDPYARSFRHVSTHLLLTTVSEAQVWEALKTGRAYVAFDWIADPTGFVYQAELGGDTWPLGSELPLVKGLRLRAEAPLEARFKLVRDGTLIDDQKGTALDFAVDTPGVYRVELWLDIAGESRPWILTNPIYVREKG